MPPKPRAFSTGNCGIHMTHNQFSLTITFIYMFASFMHGKMLSFFCKTNFAPRIYMPRHNKNLRIAKYCPMREPVTCESRALR